MYTALQATILVLPLVPAVLCLFGRTFIKVSIQKLQWQAQSPNGSFVEQTKLNIDQT
jgi:hypothetical protein